MQLYLLKTLSKYLVNLKTLLSLLLATTKNINKTSFFVARGGVFILYKTLNYGRIFGIKGKNTNFYK